MAEEILLVRLGGLGDLMVILPSLRLLRRCFSGARISIVCREEYGGLFKEFGLVEEVVPADSGRLARLFGEGDRPDPDLSRWLKRFGRVWGFLHQSSPAKLELSLRNHGIGSVRIFGPPSGQSLSLYEYFFERTAEAIKKKGFSGNFKDFCRLTPFPKADTAEKPVTPPVIIHPGSGSRKKCWPLENFVRISDRLADKSIGGMMITGEAEEWLEEKLAKHRFPAGWEWICRPSLVPFAGQLSLCRLYLGNDSGVTHLAAVCGARVLALFPNDKKRIWKPCGQTSLISSANVLDVSFEEVWGRVKKILHISQCKEP